MRGSIRLVVGFLMVFGAMGGLDNAMDSDLYLCVALAAAGLALMFSGINATNQG